MLLFFLIGSLVVTFRENLLPAKLSYDGDAIQRIALGLVDSSSDPSYNSIGQTYSVLGLADKPLLAGFTGYFMSFIVLIIALRRTGRTGLTPAEVVFMGVTILLSSVYLGYYSKDVLVLVVTLIVCTPSARRRMDFAAFGTMVLYGLLVRQYWLLIAVIFVGFRLYLDRLKTRFRIAVFALLGVAALSLTIYLVLHLAPDSYRTQVNLGRIDSVDASSMIQPFLSAPQPLGGVANNILTFLSLIVPLPLARAGGIYYLLLSGLILFIWSLFFRSLKIFSSATFSFNRQSVAVARASAVIISFLCVQSVFEPDYGSALRHLTPLLPAVFFVISSARGINGSALVAMRSVPES